MYVRHIRVFVQKTPPLSNKFTYEKLYIVVDKIFPCIDRCLMFKVMLSKDLKSNIPMKNLHMGVQSGPTMICKYFEFILKHLVNVFNFVDFSFIKKMGYVLQ